MRGLHPLEEIRRHEIANHPDHDSEEGREDHRAFDGPMGHFGLVLALGFRHHHVGPDAHPDEKANQKVNERRVAPDRIETRGAPAEIGDHDLVHRRIKELEKGQEQNRDGEKHHLLEEVSACEIDLSGKGVITLEFLFHELAPKALKQGGRRSPDTLFSEGGGRRRYR